MRACVHVHACMRACVHACMRACVRACVRESARARARVCVCVCVWVGGWVGGVGGRGWGWKLAKREYLNIFCVPYFLPSNFPFLNFTLQNDQT